MQTDSSEDTAQTNEKPERPVQTEEIISEDSSFIEAFDVIHTNLTKNFPKARLSISMMQKQTNGSLNTTVYSSGEELGHERPVYYASAVKPIFATLTAERATQLDILPEEKIIPIHISTNLAREMYTDFVEDQDHPGSEEKGYPYVSRMIMPHIKEDQFLPFAESLQARGKLSKNTVLILETYTAITDSVTKNAAITLAIGYADVRGDATLLEALSIDKDQFLSDPQNPLGNASVSDLIQSAVGPSSNYAIERMVFFLSRNLPARYSSAQDYMQERVDTILGTDAQFTFNRSSKEEKTGLWNAGNLSELLILTRHMFDHDGTFSLSDEYQHMIIDTMKKEYSDPFILTRSYFPKEPSPGNYPISKSGYFFDLDTVEGKTNSMPRLVSDNNWSADDGEYFTYILTIERYKDTDFAVAIGIPHDLTDQSDLSNQKKEATEIVLGGIAPLIQ